MFSLVCFAAALYAIGNWRNFTEKTQFLLLNIILYAGLFLAVCALFDFVFNAGFTLLKQKKHIPLKSLVFLILGLAALIFSGIAAAILVLTTGNIE
ncbi:MAG: hypothetical protein LBB47_01855 [Spirochaetaceae bacterium]|nr:hypothetical protein [Spirochaetaceae bacterium]